MLYATKSAFTDLNLCWACALASPVTFLTSDHVMQIRFGQISHSASSTRDPGTRLENGDLQYEPFIMLIPIVCLTGYGTALKFILTLKAKRSDQFKNVFRSLALLNTQFRVKDSFKLSLGEKSQNSLAIKSALNYN